LTGVPLGRPAARAPTVLFAILVTALMLLAIPTTAGQAGSHPTASVSSSSGISGIVPPLTAVASDAAPTSPLVGSQPPDVLQEDTTQTPLQLGALASPLASDPSLARPLAGPLATDPSNPELDNYSSTTSVVQAGPSNQSVVVGATDESTLVDGAGSFWQQGLSAAFRTSDGGQAWSTNWLGQNGSWANPSSWSYGDISFGEPSLAGGSTPTVLYASVYAQPCAFFAYDFGLGVGCNSTAHNISAPGGIDVARSTNFGATWDAPVPVDNLSWYRFVVIDCSGSVGSGGIPANISDKPSVAYSSATGIAVVAWDVIDYDDYTLCVGSTPEYAVSSISEYTEVSVSLNNGSTWSAPRIVGRLAASVPTVAIGPAPTYTLSLVYSDLVNGTATTYTYAYSQSTDRGAHWSAPADIGPITLIHPNAGAPPDGFVAPTIPSMAVDNWSDSSFAGTIYVVWGDNRTSAAQGLPSVELVRSAAGGTVWSGADVVDPAGAGKEYFEPAVSVGPDGRVWLVFYEMNTTTGGYQLFGQYSDDGGVTWTTPFAVADTPGYPGIAVTSIGAWVGAAATSAGLYSAWTDCRWSGCADDGITAVYAAHTEPVTVESSVAGAFAMSSADGSTAASMTPLRTAWDNDASVAVNVSAWVPYGNTTRYVAVFSNFSGVVASTSDSVFFDYGGGSVLSANYAPAPAAWISGTIGPTSGSPTLTVDGKPATLTPWNATALAFNVTVEAGVLYAVSASGHAYTPYSAEVPTSPFRAAPLNISLARSDGWIRGRLQPANATLTVNGTAVTTVNPSTGLFNVSVGWGSYWVNASGTGLNSSSQDIVVTPGAATVVDFGLVGGWIDGVTSPPNATVRIDGVVVSHTGATFNVSVLGGTHEVSASIPGYTFYRAQVNVTPTRASDVVITLTDSGWVRGSVAPVTASVRVGGSLVPVIDGAFNVSVRGGTTYNVTVSATGFQNGFANVAVTPGNASFANFTLIAVTPTCTTSCGGSGAPPGSTSGAALPYSWVDVGIAAVVLLGAALLVAFLLLRGTGGAGAAPEAGPASPGDEQLYGADGSTPAQDGSPPTPDGTEPRP
jgi:hypothetical protein